MAERGRLANVGGLLPNIQKKILRNDGESKSRQNPKSPENTSDSVSRVNESTRVTIFSDSDSTRVTLRKMMTRDMFFLKWLRSSHNQWLETRDRVIFTKSLSLWWANPVRFHTKEWALFASVMFEIGASFMFWLSSRAILPFKDQVSPTCTEVETLHRNWNFAFH